MQAGPRGVNMGQEAFPRRSLGEAVLQKGGWVSCHQARAQSLIHLANKYRHSFSSCTDDYYIFAKTDAVQQIENY